MLCQALDAVAAKPAFRLPEVVETLKATVGLNCAMARCTSADAKRIG